MFEIGLRFFVLFLCAGVIVTAVQVAFWSVKPWHHGLRQWWSLDFQPQQRVVLGPVDLIEDDKIKTVEGRTIAKQIEHEIHSIHEVLERDLKSEYLILKGIGVDTSTSGGQVFTTPTSQNFDFRAEVFKFDVVGFIQYVRGTLEKNDAVVTMIDMGDTGSRVFVEISPVKSPKSRSIAETGPSLKTAVSTAACTIVLSYLDGEAVYKGLTGETFCIYMESHRQLNDFIALSARDVNARRALEPSRVLDVAKLFERIELAATTAPIVNLQLASLYRLAQRHENALTRLETVAEVVPEHPFVVQNLQAWRDEKASRENPRTASVSATVLEGHFEEMRSQPGLMLVNYSAMLEWLQGSSDRMPTKIAVLDTGYTPPNPPLTAPLISPGLSFVEGEEPTDLQGHGNMVTNLMAALLPMSEFEILPMKVLGNSGAGRESDIFSGMARAIDDDAGIICMALGRGAGSEETSDPIYDDIAELAAQNGTLILAASGNGSQREFGHVAPVGIPANSPKIIAVGSLDQTGAWTNSSSGDASIDLAFPGRSLLTYDGVFLRQTSGSISSSIACAVVAAARAIDPGLTRKALLNLADQASDQKVKNGPKVVDALKFIQLVDEQK